MISAFTLHRLQSILRCAALTIGHSEYVRGVHNHDNDNTECHSGSVFGAGRDQSWFSIKSLIAQNFKRLLTRNVNQWIARKSLWMHARSAHDTCLKFGCSVCILSILYRSKHEISAHKRHIAICATNTMVAAATGANWKDCAVQRQQRRQPVYLPFNDVDGNDKKNQKKISGTLIGAHYAKA